MNARKRTAHLTLDRQGVDEASNTIQSWLEEASLPERDILRIRLTMEEILSVVCEHGNESLQAELLLVRLFGEYRFYIRYNGSRFDPVTPEDKDNEEAVWTAALLAHTGFMPSWRWRAGKNELILRIPSRKNSPELLMLGCIGAAIILGILGQFIPAGIKAILTADVLFYLSEGFLHLLNTFIGLMIFLSIITGICGIGSASGFERIGKLMVSRFLSSTFLTGVFLVAAARLFFPLGSGEGGSSFQISTILDMIFGILPSNPIQPFLSGNTLQIVFLASIVGLVLLLTGSETQDLRTFFIQAQTLIAKCVTGVCMLLPVYIFSSLLMLFWENGTGILLRLWKPLTVCTLLCLIVTAANLLVVCRKLHVKASVLLPKLLPVYLIALSTSSSAATFSTSMEINEKKLGIDPPYFRTAIPIGTILFAGLAAALYVFIGVFLAEQYQVNTDFSWWIILWFVCSLLAIATPPVAGGVVSCLSIMLLQLHIPQEGLAIGTTLALLLDFICTSFRVLMLHFEVILQADRLDLIDRELLRQKM